MDARLMIDAPARGSWNMGVDEALFQSARRSRQMTVRFYQWSEPTLSLGYFQPANQRQSHRPSHPCRMVRRSTGGGAILHDRELTYSLVSPIASDRSTDSQRFVRAVHGALIDALAGMGVRARRHGDDSRLSQPFEPFLCFQRRAAEDILIGDFKIAGSAQRKLHGVLLQHGSVLLGRSEAAPELPGISDLVEEKLTAKRLMDAWLVSLERELTCHFTPAVRDRAEEQLAEKIEQERFATAQWNQKR